MMRTRILVLTVLATLAALALATGFILVWRLLFVLMSVILVGYLWTILAIRGIRCQVMPLPKRCQVGDYFDEEFVVSNSSRMPKFIIEVQESTNLPGHQNTVTLNLGPGSYQYLRTKVDCRQRGQYYLGSLTITAVDPFGLFSQQRNCGEPQGLLVCPATVELPFFELSPRHGSRIGIGSWLVSQSSATVGGVRQYTTGDSLKHVHWPRTAHAGKLLVKMLDHDRSHHVTRSVWIVVDMCHSSYLNGSDETVEECCLTVAASLVKKYIYGGMAVGLIAVGELPYLSPAESGEQHLWHMLTAMAVMKAAGDVPVDQLILNESGHFGRESALIVITPSSSERLVSSLRRVRTPRELTTVVLLDGYCTETRRAADVVHALKLSGAQVHLVSPRDDLTSALDSRGF